MVTADVSTHVVQATMRAYVAVGWVAVQQTAGVPGDHMLNGQRYPSTKKTCR